MFKYLCGCRGLATRQGLSSGDKTENMEVRVSSGALNKKIKLGFVVVLYPENCKRERQGVKKNGRELCQPD